MEIISHGFLAFCQLLTIEGVFVTGLLLLFNGFFVNLIIAVSSSGYTRRVRTWLPISAGMILCFIKTVTIFLGSGEWAIYAYGFIALPTVYFSYLFRKKKRPITAEQIQFAKFLQSQREPTRPEFIDGEYMQNRSPREVSGKTVCTNNAFAEQCGEREQDGQSCSKITPSNIQSAFEKPKKEEYELDFTHVKNVLKRLDYFSLSNSDRRQVKDLEISLAQAEGGDYSSDLRERINDGLGALLKIMSKHGA